MFTLTKELSATADRPLISPSNVTASPAPTSPTRVDAPGPSSEPKPAAAPDNGSSSSSSPSAAAALRPQTPSRPGGGSWFLQRVANVPLVRGLAGVYGSVRAWPLVGCTLSLLGQAAWVVSAPAAVLLSPLAGVCSAPAACADWCACKGLKAAEQILPCLFVPADEVLSASGTCLSNYACFVPRVGARAVNFACRWGNDGKREASQ